MKSLLSLLALLIISGSVFSQAQPSVTINVVGNKAKQIIVDDKTYTINNTGISQEQAIVINDLATGSHALQIVKNSWTTSSKSTFTLRDGYDLTLSISSNGSITTSEKKIANSGYGQGNGWGNNNNAITTAAFNKLVTQTKSKTTSAARSAFLENEFTASQKKFTSKQASQLIQLVNSESLRLKLAKQSYIKISDTENFSLITNLLNSSYNKTELNNYIASIPADTDNGDAGTINDTNTPLTNDQFISIRNEVVSESSNSDKNYFLNNFFSRDYNFYTSNQAKQLIELVTGEQERFNLAKAAYRGVTNKENYGEVYQLLNNVSNRSALVAYINSYDVSNPKTAMSTVDFDKLYQSVYYQNSNTARYTAINKAFATSGNYFTTAQAKKIIPLVNDENSRLLLSKSAYKVLVDKANYTQFNDFLNTYSRTDFNNYVVNYDNSYGLGTTAMNETDFNKLYNSISNSWSTSTRLNLANTAFTNQTNYFTVAQARKILLLINSESDRLGLAKNSYDNITDQSNYSQLYDIFNSSTSRNDLANFASIQSGETGTTAIIKTPMTETEFNSVYRNVQLTFGIGAKYSALTEVFNKETNYFTVQQTKQLIQMVSSESNRLDLAKLSYNNISDIENFTQIYDIFSSQSSKNELQTYVNSSAYNN